MARCSCPISPRSGASSRAASRRSPRWFRRGRAGDAAQRAAGLRYLTRFLAAGLRLCIESDDADHPVFARMIENAMSWGLDNPDCNYSWARVRGDASYRIEGTRGSARQIEFQVNTGHFADGKMPALSGGEGGWRTVSHLAGDQLESEPDGRFAIALSRERASGQLAAPRRRGVASCWCASTSTTGRTSSPACSRSRARTRATRPRRSRPSGCARASSSCSSGSTRARCWDKVSRLLLSLPPNTLLMFDVPNDLDRPGLHGQSYGMGPFACAHDEAVIVEFPVPRCRMWSVALTNFWWESLEFGARQTSLNSHWARVDADGVFRGVIAHRDPGVPNWLDAEGCERGTLAVRFLFADATPKPRCAWCRSTGCATSCRATRPPDARRAQRGARAPLAALQRRYAY